MAQPEIWEDDDYESDTDVRYDFGSEDTDEEDSRKRLYDKPNRRSNYEDLRTRVTRKRRKPLIEVEPREPRKPIPTEEPRKNKKIEKDRRTKTKIEIDKREEDGEQFYDKANKDEEQGNEEEGDEEEEEEVEVLYGEANKDEEEGVEEESGDEEEEEEDEEEDYEEDYGEEYIIRPEDLETPYPKETMTPEEHEELVAEIATMLGAKDEPPDPDAFIPLDLLDGLKIGDEKWNAMMAQITKPHPYEEYMPKHHKTPAELIWEMWDRQDYNEGRYVDPGEFKDNDLSVPKDIDFEEIQKLAKMIEEGKSIPDYYQ